MTIDKMNQAQLDELREAYAEQLNMELDEYITPDMIDDEMLLEHYGDIDFDEYKL